MVEVIADQLIVTAVGSPGDVMLKDLPAAAVTLGFEITISPVAVAANEGAKVQITIRAEGRRDGKEAIKQLYSLMDF